MHATHRKCRTLPRHRTFLAAIPLAALLAGCGDDPAEGTITLAMTDRPFPADLVRTTEVVIDSVSVRTGSGGESDDGGFVTIDRTQRTIDVLELRNGVTESLGSGLVPAGEVDQLRVYVGDATVTLTDDRMFPLKFPSGSSSGVKVFPSPPVVIPDGETVAVLLDFDLSQSFSAIPNAPTNVDDITGFSFHPVLRAANLVDVGAVSGTVFDDAGTPSDTSDDTPLPGAAIVLTQGTDEITSTVADALGRYVVMGVAPGDYTVTASLPAGYLPASAAVTVQAAVEASGIDLLLSPVPAS